MVKYKQFITDLEAVLAKFSTEEIKLKIGDSINNNRVITVNQLVRFLSTRRNANYKALGVALTTTYGLLKDNISIARAATYRTDAFDINEFINMYNDVVLEGTTSTRSNFNRVLKVA